MAEGWYSTRFEVSDAWEGRSVHLRFEAVDVQAWVYVNGREGGKHTKQSEERP